MSAEALLSAGKVASFRMQVSRTTRKVGPGASQRPCASLGFDERNRLGLGHRLAAVLAVRSRQRRGKLEPNHLPANDGRRMHDTSVREGRHRHKRCDAPAFRRVCCSFVRTKQYSLTCSFWPRDRSRFDAQPPSVLALNWTRGTET